MAPMAPNLFNLEAQNTDILSKTSPLWAVFWAPGEFSTGDNCTTCPLRTFSRRVHVPLVPRRSDATGSPPSSVFPKDGCRQNHPQEKDVLFLLVPGIVGDVTDTSACYCSTNGCNNKKISLDDGSSGSRPSPSGGQRQRVSSLNLTFVASFVLLLSLLPKICWSCGSQWMHCRFLQY